jgi:dTDP-4-amino-4,6-dideoxygalactose transaminase
MDITNSSGKRLKMIFYANPKAQYLPYKDEIDAAILKVLESGKYILGEQVSLFEKEFAKYLDAGFVVGCGSGTDALVLALKALDIGPGDEVIVPSHTATATVAAVVMVGAKPLYVDIEPEFFTLDPDRVEGACTGKVKAIIAVHLYGQAAAMDDLMAIAKRHDLWVIEDCAQSTGASFNGRKLGAIGDIGCFSFFPTKNLGAVGDGGAISCKDAETADRLRRLRQYGWDENRISQKPGMNSRLDEIQAAILRVKLRYLDVDNEERRRQARHYMEELADLAITLPEIRDGASHVYHLFVIQAENRDMLLQRLRDSNIALGIHYLVPAHQMPSFFSEKNLSVTDCIVKKIISLPIYPGLSKPDQECVLSALRSMPGVASK